MTIMRPGVALRAGGGGGLSGAASSPVPGGALGMAEAAVHRLTVDLSVDAGHDRVGLTLSHLSPLAEIEPATPLAVGLGDGRARDVLTAEVHRIDRSAAGVDLVALAPSHRLSDVFVARSYVRQSVADVVEDLLSEGEVDAGDVEAPQALPAYHVDGRRSVWSSLHELARRFGATITTTPAGAVSFTPAPGAAAGGLGGVAGAVGDLAAVAGLGGGAGYRSGANVLGSWVGPRGRGPRPTFTVVPLGAASPAGAERWHHLLKQPDGGAGPSVVDPAVKDTAGGDGATAARSALARRAAKGGRIELPGDPSLRPGGTVTVDDGEWHIAAVRHLVSPAAGFRTRLTVEALP